MELTVLCTYLHHQASYAVEQLFKRKISRKKPSDYDAMLPTSQLNPNMNRRGNAKQLNKLREQLLWHVLSCKKNVFVQHVFREQIILWKHIYQINMVENPNNNGIPEAEPPSKLSREE
jgi:hypothetical protein